MKLFHRRNRASVLSPRTDEPKEEVDLKELCKGDANLFDALEYFLLLDPEGQSSSLGGPNSLLERANEEKDKGKNVAARIDYETAARIEIARGNMQNASRCLTLADEVCELEIHRQRHQVMLQNMDKVMEISKEYYAKLRRNDSPVLETKQETILTV